MSWYFGKASEHEIADREFKQKRYENYGIDIGVFDDRKESIKELYIMMHIMKDEEIPQDLEEEWLKERFGNGL